MIELTLTGILTKVPFYQDLWSKEAKFQGLSVFIRLDNSSINSRSDMKWSKYETQTGL